MISATFPYQKKRQEVLGQEMAYVEVGSGDPIVFLHGNPTSSYLWRNIIPYLEGLGRCIAPDLIGMGDSEKLPNSGPDSYTFVEHRRYLDALLDLLGVKERVTFVVHDWGSALGFDWANRHRDAVKGIVYMEAIVNPRTWSDFPDAARQNFEALRSPAGEKLVLEQNAFVETLLRLVLRGLTAEEMAQYRRSFAEPGEGRRPTLTWPRQIPIDGEPADVTAIVQDYGAWLSGCDIPNSLFIPIRGQRLRLHSISAGAGPHRLRSRCVDFTIRRKIRRMRSGRLLRTGYKTWNRFRVCSRFAAQWQGSFEHTSEELREKEQRG